jgi:hypothetical protein
MMKMVSKVETIGFLSCFPAFPPLNWFHDFYHRSSFCWRQFDQEFLHFRKIMNRRFFGFNLELHICVAELMKNWAIYSHRKPI